MLASTPFKQIRSAPATDHMKALVTVEETAGDDVWKGECALGVVHGGPVKAEACPNDCKPDRCKVGLAFKSGGPFNGAISGE